MLHLEHIVCKEKKGFKDKLHFSTRLLVVYTEEKGLVEGVHQRCLEHTSILFHKNQGSY